MIMPRSRGMKNVYQTIFFSLVGTIVIARMYLNQNHVIVEETENENVINIGKLKPKCDLFKGKWIQDNNSHPLYKERECNFMSDQLSCEKFGRKDLGFQSWRWQPHSCDLPRFNATALLQRMRNKRMVFVGDSLNRGQWVSMVCLIDAATTSSFMRGTAFHENKYNVTVEFYWSPLLVESNADDPVGHRVANRTVRVESISKHARHWTDADIIVFNSYLWWRRSQMNVQWGEFGSTESIQKLLHMPRVYELALKTWSDWLEIQVNRTKTQLFFMSASPTHQKAADWGEAIGKNCYGERSPISIDGYRGKDTSVEMIEAVERTIGELRYRGVEVHLMNITRLSEVRKDGHPSIYRKQWEPLTQDQLLNPQSYADCIHWCLPGVPDVWNHLLYSYIMQV